MAPNTKRPAKPESLDLVHGMEKGSMDTVCPVPLDEVDPARLGKFASFLIGGIVIALYLYGMYTLYVTYATNYFRQGIPATEVGNLLQAWSPLYFIGMVMEFIFAYIKGRDIYTLSDTLTSLTTFSIRVATTQFLSTIFLCYGLYGVVWNNYGQYIHAAVLPTAMQESALCQFIGIVIFDEFAYYWVHRTGHTISFFWHFHQVHHNGEYYNLISSIRNSVIVRFSSIAYYLPLALLFDPPVFIIFRQFNLVYQFWIHTEFIGKLGWLEFVFNTPSQHRVHHGRQQYCIDRNFGGMTCIFDRLFGTFQEEIDEVPPVYGLTSPFQSLDPWKINWKPWADTISTMRSLPTWKDCILLLCNGPGRIPATNPPEEYPIPPITRNTYQKMTPVFSRPIKLLLVFEVCLAIAVFSVTKQKIAVEPQHYWYLMAIIGYTGFSAFTITSVSDHRPACGIIQLLTAFFGVLLFSFGSYLRYSPELWSQSMLEVAVYSVVGLLVAWVVLVHKSEIEAPLEEHLQGKDLPFAKEAEEAQWRYYEESKRKQKTN